MASTRNTRAAALNMPAVITVAQWQAHQEALALLQAQFAAMQAGEGFAENDDLVDDDDTISVAADDDNEFADDEDGTVEAADDTDEDGFGAGYYFNADDTSAVYIDSEGWGYEVAANGKIAKEASDVDMDEHNDYAGDLTVAQAKARLAAAAAPPARPTQSRRVAEVEDAAPARRTVNDLTPDELRERITKAGGDPAKIVGAFTGKARTTAMQTWLKAFTKAKRETSDLTSAKRAATKAVSAMSAGRSMG